MLCNRSRFKGFPLTAGFKGCILITLSHFVRVLYVKIDRFHIPTNLEHSTYLSKTHAKLSIQFCRYMSNNEMSSSSNYSEIRDLATPVPSSGATGQADPHRNTQTF